MGDSLKRQLWKWLLVLVLIWVAAVIWWGPARPVQSGPVKVELLPFSDIPPAWDGSRPTLII